MESQRESPHAEASTNSMPIPVTKVEAPPQLVPERSHDDDATAHKEKSISPSDENVDTKATRISLQEIMWMRRRIDELEKAAVEGVKAVRPRFTHEASEYQKLEGRLLKHRKDFEATRSQEPSTMFFSENKYLEDSLFSSPHGPWRYVFTLAQRPNLTFPRPDVFDDTKYPDSESKTQDNEMEDLELDDFDHVIDFESRRARARKGFEWEMDRLYLMEEYEKRRRARQEESKKQAELGKTARGFEKGNTVAQGQTQGGKGFQWPEPQLNRVDWDAFRRFGLRKTKTCEIDVLMGEPVIQDTRLSFNSWFSMVASTKRKKPRGNVGLAARNPEDSPLPERVRIHSGILLKIMARILGSDGTGLATLGDTGTPVVFIRPFKALIYCEEGLREFFAVLQKRYTVSSDVVVEDTGHEESAKPTDHNQWEGSPEARLTTPDEMPRQGGSKKEEGEHEEEEEEEEENLDDEEEEEEEEKEGRTTEDETWSLESLKHMLCLLKLIDADIKPKRDYLKYSQSRKLFFSDLWHLFWPGMEVVGNDGKQAYRVIQVSSAPHRVVAPWQRFRQSDNEEEKKPQPPFSLTCVYIDFDGTSFGPVSKTFEFKRFEGQRDVTSLEVYPLRLHPVKRADFEDQEWKEMESLSASERSSIYRQRLIQRGGKFLSVAKIKHMYYAGPTLGIRDEVESQVVIDFETAFAVEDKEQQEWKPQLESIVGQPAPDPPSEEDLCQSSCCREEDVHDDSYVDFKYRETYINNLLPEIENDESQTPLGIVPRSLKELQTGDGKGLSVSEHDLLIMSYRVFGFVLRTRKWAQLDLSYLTDVHHLETSSDGESRGWEDSNRPSASAFERLVLEKRHKEMIISLISQHFKDKSSSSGQREQVDIVRGKGKGLILLLHGAPGVGKTSTAEGVAELFQKPLFQITCGDLGTTAKEVETALETTFALANRWDCILLLDEADVFLSQRTKEDFQRNGLVAVFLRVMEYYAGILFLTTNRVGDFDEAFTSRIHVSLYYPELSCDKTVGVFKLNLDLIEKRFHGKGRSIQIEQFEIASFASRHFTDHPNARWNGRQIRNACQTALAIAEFEAQGKRHRAIESPQGTITLSVRHFEYVRDAYIEFAKYIDKLHGTNAARRAQEEKVRTIWLNDSDQIVATQGFDQKALFARAAGYQSHSPGPRPSSTYPVAPDYQQASRPYPGYSDSLSTGAPMSAYQYHPQMSTPERPIPTGGWDSSGRLYGHQSTHSTNSAHGNPGLTPESFRPRGSPQPPEQSQVHQHPQHEGSAWFHQGIASMYEGSGTLDQSQSAPHPRTPTPGGA